MREYLPRRGRLAWAMMKQTASIQVNLDYSSEADAVEKLRTAMGLSPLVTALYANSPLAEGRTNGYHSFRCRVWQETDPDRCGLLPFVFREDAGVADYIDYALGVPMFFVVRGDSWRPAHHLTFRRFILDGLDGERATYADFGLHLTTLFPEVRLKRYLEVRGADSGEAASSLALAAFWKGILYEAGARRRAWSLVEGLTFKERLRLLEDAGRLGPAAPIPGLQGGASPVTVREALADLIPIARQGLRDLGAPPEEPALLDLLERRLAGPGGCPAARLIADWSADPPPSPASLIASLSRAGSDAT